MSETTAAVTEAPEPSAPIPPQSPPQSPDPRAASKAYFAEHKRTMDLKGKDYLGVAGRVRAFRLDFPIESGWRIITRIVAGSFPDKWIEWVCEIINPEGEVVATGHKQENPPADARGCQDWVDKGETGAIGRALGNCGYGTEAALEEDADNPCDAPRERPQIRGPQQQQARPAAPAPAPKPAAPAAPLPPCVVCGKPIDSAGRAKFCESKSLPPSCIDKACSTHEKAIAKKG